MIRLAWKRCISAAAFKGLWSCACIVVLFGSAGCAAGGAFGDRSVGGGTVTRLGPEAFVAEAAAPEDAGELEVERPPVRLGAGSADSGSVPTISQPSPPVAAPRTQERPLGPGDRVIVESMVGQINGRPFFADRFFVPIADQLAALGRRLPMRDFVESARIIIANHLQAEVLNALFVAEAQSLLTQEEQIGLRAWLASTREVVTARRGGGTVEAARRRIREEEGGMTLEQLVEDIRDAQLLRQLFERRIEPRVIVSQLDIEREYARRFAEFNPPARVSLDRIRLSPRTQQELIDSVRERLEEGVPFAVIAEEIGPPAAGPWQDFEVPGGDLTRVDFPDPSIREAMHALDAPGSVTRALTVGTAVWWLSVRSIDQQEGRSVYDPHVQRQLAADIRGARMSEEQQRFTASLLREGIYDEMGGMVERLLVIAADRYGPRF